VHAPHYSAPCCCCCDGYYSTTCCERGSVPWRSRYCPTPRQTSVRTVRTSLPVPLSIPRQCCCGACSSSNPTGTSTCLAVSTLHVTISHFWNSASSQRRIYKHAGGLSTQDASLNLQWRDRCSGGGGRVRERHLPPITAENYGSERLYYDKQYISLTKLDLQYLARNFHIVQ